MRWSRPTSLSQVLALTFAGAFLGFFAAAEGGLPVVPAAVIGGLAGLIGSRITSG